MAFVDTLHRATWRGVPFAMELATTSVGRRKVEHAYPFRDSAWYEDLGKLPKTFQLLGFLVGNSALYGGGDLQSQRKRMEAAAEAEGMGTLVHPSRGRIQVDLLNLVMTERWDEGNYLELQFTFAQGGTQLAAALGALGDLIAKAGVLADAAGLSSFVSSVLGPLQRGVGVAASIAETATEWFGAADALARDATSLYGTVSQLGGANYGRYFNGRNAGFLSGLSSPYAGAASVADLINTGAEKRVAVATAGEAVQEAIVALGVTTTPADVGQAVQGVVGALEAAIADPADGVRVLGALSTFQPIGPASATPAGQAVSDLYRRAAVTGMARMSAAYQPASGDDAHAVRVSVVDRLDVTIARAGAVAADEPFLTLRNLRKAVVEDLAQRGGSLARLAQVNLAANLPDVVVAEQRYGDAARAPELVTQADPVHPLFMPRSFRALSQ